MSADYSQLIEPEALGSSVTVEAPPEVTPSSLQPRIGMFPDECVEFGLDRAFTRDDAVKRRNQPLGWIAAPRRSDPVQAAFVARKSSLAESRSDVSYSRMHQWPKRSAQLTTLGDPQSLIARPCRATARTPEATNPIATNLSPTARQQ